MYEKFALELKKGNETTTIEYLTGVHQGDNLAPLLFVLVFQAAMESLQLSPECEEISKPQYKYFPNTKADKPRGRLTSQNPSAKGTAFTHWLSLYVDDSAFILPTREDATKTANLTLNHLKRFGLQMHTGSIDKKSKTEVLFVPKRSEQNKPTDLSPIILSNGTQITYTKRFTYLGSVIASDLSDDPDITLRISKANQAFGSLRSLIFCNPFIPLEIKRYFYIAITVNLLLWGNECWALSTHMLKKLECFHSKCCRAILGISMWEVSMYKVKNIHILARLYMPTMESFIHFRRLVWIGKIASMPFTRNPRIFLNAWISNPRPTGRPNLTTRESFLKSLKYLHEHGGEDFKNVKCPNGKLEQWLPIAQLPTIDWLEKIEFLRETRMLNEVDFYKT